MMRTECNQLTKTGMLLSIGLLMSFGSSASLDTLETPKATPIASMGGTMNNDKLEEVLKSNGRILEGAAGFWQVQYLDRVLTVVTDASNNRMRIMTAVIHQKDLKKTQTVELLKAQFDRALDVKYALYNEVLWSAFVHPLKELTEEQVKDALSQVYFAAYNFGGSYRSTELQFGNRTD